MSKIKQTDITKLSQLEQLKEQKKKQEEQLSNKIDSYFLNELDLNMINSSVELYKIMDKVIEEFNKDFEQNGSDENNENLKENEINQNSK